MTLKWTHAQASERRNFQIVQSELRWHWHVFLTARSSWWLRYWKPWTSRRRMPMVSPILMSRSTYCLIGRRNFRPRYLFYPSESARCFFNNPLFRWQTLLGLIKIWLRFSACLWIFFPSALVHLKIHLYQPVHFKLTLCICSFDVNQSLVHSLHSLFPLSSSAYLISFTFSHFHSGFPCLWFAGAQKNSQPDF